jgi:hypothetical protein
MDVAPVQFTPHYLKEKSMPSDSSLETSRVSPVVLTETSSRDDNFYVVDKMSESPADPPRRPSPRSHIGAAQQVDPSRRPRTVYSGPLEKFLAQDDEALEIDPPKRQQEWGRLRTMRANALRIRAQLREMRKTLHEKESTKRSADEAFIKHVRGQRSLLISQSATNTQAASDPILDPLYEAMQTARDEYGPLEDDVNRLEDQLDQQEFEIAKMEGRLYNTRIHETPKPEPTLLGLSAEPPKELPSLYIRYLSRLGDLDLSKERHQNMAQERDRLLYVQESKTRVGLELHRDEREFLELFSAREAALFKEIADIEEDVERHKQQCLEEGIELAESSIGDISDTEEDATSQDHPSEQTSVDPSMFSLLLPKSDEDKVKLGVLITDFDEANKNDRINRWMRYQLQSSPLEVELLVRIFLHLLKIVDLRQWQAGLFQWQVCVSVWWDYDDANQQLYVFKLPSAQTSLPERLSSTVENALALSERTATLPGVSMPIRRIRSAPPALDLAKICGKGELSKAKVLLASF